MKIISAAILLFFIFCLTVCAQKVENGCPQISLVLPEGVLNYDKTVNLFAKIDGENKKTNLRYEWKFSDGKILEGQGTPTIKFVADGLDRATHIEISLKVIGLPEKCENIFSEIMPIAQNLDTFPMDEFGKLKLGDLKARLDNFLISLQSDPNDKGLLEINFNKRNSRSYKIARLQNCLNFLEFKKFDLTRISFAVSEGDYEEVTKVWLVPPEAELPVESNSQIIEAAKLKQKINGLFLKK